MTSLKSVLAFNMKAQRHILRISQAKLAERVDTSTNYIALIESERKFPSLEMLERIAVALEIDPPALFTPPNYPNPEDRMLANVTDRIIDDFVQIIARRVAKLNRESPPDDLSGSGNGPTIV